MKVSEAFVNIRSLFLDTAPLIYLVEGVPPYDAVMRQIFASVDSGVVSVVTSPVTLTECLVGPYRRGLTELERSFKNRIVSGSSTRFVPTTFEIADHAAQLRAIYNLALADALQVATAIRAGCDAVLTNDLAFSRVVELPIILIDQMEIG